MKLAPYDELTVLREMVTGVAKEDLLTPETKRRECGDLLFDILLMSYLYGTDDAYEMLGIPTDDFFVDGVSSEETIYKDIAGKTFRDRVEGYVDDDGNVDVDAIMKVAETEITRDYNSGVLETAKAAVEHGKTSGVTKTWVTMMDDKVRDTHDFLEGVTVPLDERFFTYDGDSAMAPGGFEDPSNNINCRCGIFLKGS